jgi:CCR4-NOT transcription complex subunit 2
MNSPIEDVDSIRSSLKALSVVVREMTPTGGKAIPANPHHFNLLARPSYNNCRICGLSGHHSTNIQLAFACKTAFISLIQFWEDVASHIAYLYEHSNRFQNAVKANEPTYEMRLDDGGLKGGELENVLVERLTRAWLKFQSHMSRHRAKINVCLNHLEQDMYEVISERLNGFLLDGLTRKLLASRG